MADTTAVPTDADTTGSDTLTSYVILVTRDGENTGDHWTVATRLRARSADDAIRRLLDGRTDQFPHACVAVPERSWKPVSVTARQTVTLDLKPAT